MASAIAVARAVPLSAGARQIAVQGGSTSGSGAKTASDAAVERPRATSAGTSSTAATAAAAHARPQAPHRPTFPSHHGGPFGAVAALLAASLQRAERGRATYTHLDVLLPGNQAGSRAPQESSEKQGCAAGPAESAGAGGDALAAARQERHQTERPHRGQQAVGAESASQNTAAGPRLSNNQQQPLLLIEDDAAGLSPQQLRRSLGIPSRANSFSSLVAAGSRASSTSSRAASCAASQCPDFVHAALRLGSTVLVLTKRRGQGASVGLLHASSAPTGRDEAWLEAAVVDFAADGSRRLTPSGAAIQPAAPANSASTLAWHSAAEAAAAETASSAWTAAAGTVCRRWPGGATEAQLAAELAALPEQGTCLLVAGLYTQAASAAGALGEAYELNWSEDPADVQLQRGQRLAAALAAAPVQQGQQQGQQRQQAQGEPPDPGVQRCTLLRQSLRAYLAVLFLRWPEGWRLRLRGADVEHQRIRDWMRWPATEEYRPRGIRDEVDEHGFHMQHVVAIHLGMLLEAPHTAMQGICIYHQNRLVKPFWRVHSSSTVGRGVVGLLEADFLAPTAGWQDFERSHVLGKLEAFLKRAVPGYFRRHAHLLTGGAPPAKRAPGRPPPAGAAAGPFGGVLTAGSGPSGSHSALPVSLYLQPQQHMLLAVQHAQHAQLAAAAAALAGQQSMHHRLAAPMPPLGAARPAAGAAQQQQPTAAIMQELLTSLGLASQPALPPAHTSATAMQQQQQQLCPTPDLGRALLMAAQQVAAPAVALAAALQQAQQAQGQQQDLLHALLALLAAQPGNPSSAQPGPLPTVFEVPQPQPHGAPAALPPSPFESGQSPAETLLSQLQLFASAGSAPPVSAPVQAQLLQQLGALAESSESGKLASTAVGDTGDMHRLSSSGTQAVAAPPSAAQPQLQAQLQPARQQPLQSQQQGILQAAALASRGQHKSAVGYVDKAAEAAPFGPSSAKRRRQV